MIRYIHSSFQNQLAPELENFHIISYSEYSGYHESHHLFAIDMIGIQPFIQLFGLYLIRRFVIWISFGYYLKLESFFHFWKYYQWYRHAINNGKKKFIIKNKK